MAPGDDATLLALRDPERRPPVLRDPIPEDILSTRPEVPFNWIPTDWPGTSEVGRGAAGGPSGMTVDHLRPLLESEADTAGFSRMCLDFARAEIPRDVLTLLKMGRVTALRKPHGKIRGIVIGDIIRRLVARTIAQQVALACVAHAIQSLTELDGLLTVDGGHSVLPFVLRFYSEPSQYLWEDDTGDNHLIHQGEGGEQGDPLMPLLFSLGQHSALQSVQSFVLPGEQLFAHLGDLDVVCSPERVGANFTRLEIDLESHARIQVHQEKTKVWNRAGLEPEACSSMQEAAERVDPDATFWTGDGPLSQQGLRVLVIPIGTPEYVRSQLEQTSLKHKGLFNRLSRVADLQSAWLLLLFCANTRATYSLRGLPPQDTEHFATEHDADSRRCLSLLLGVSLTQVSWEKSSLPMSMGGCGLRSASRTSSSAYWASWADSLRMIHKRHPAVADQMVRSLTQVSGHRHFVAAAACRDQLIACGFSPPTWAEVALARPRAVLEALHMDGTCLPVQGWQHVASECVEDHFLQSVVLPSCLPPECALPCSQGAFIWPAVRRLPFFSPTAVRFPPLRCAPVTPSPPPTSSLVPLLSVWPSSRRPWPSPHKLPDFRGLGTSWIRPGVRCLPCLSRSMCTCENQHVREGHGSSSSSSSRPTTPRSGMPPLPWCPRSD